MAEEPMDKVTALTLVAVIAILCATVLAALWIVFG